MFLQFLQTLALPRRLRRDTDGSVSVELVIVLPLLFWALAATVVFYDGFRTRYHAQMAAQTVADIMSRETDLFTPAYVEGMNDVFDFLVDARYPTRIRVSSVIWDSTNQRNRLQWSYGTRGLSPLPADTFELLQNGDLDTLLAEFSADTSFSFDGGAAQMPVADLAQRIPPVLPGEALLVVETFALWTPFANVGLGQMRFAPVVVVRPRFAPWINFEGIDPIFPEDNYEIAWSLDDTGTTPDPDPDPTTDPNAAATYTFDNGDTTGWSASTIGTAPTTGAGGAMGGFLGPFGGETMTNPVTFTFDLASAGQTVSISFDLLILDSWDGFSGPPDGAQTGETLWLLLNGSPMSRDGFGWGFAGLYANDRQARGAIDGTGYQLTMTPTAHGSNFVNGRWNDQTWHATITLTNAPAHFTLGFSANLNHGHDNESFGIDNFSYAATSPTQTVTAYAPDPARRLSDDPHTLFRRYSGCPDTQISAPWLTVTNADLSQTTRFVQRAGGRQRLSVCGLVGNARGYVGADPDLVLNYVNTGGGNRLLLAFDDGNRGRSCDTTLLVRDPNGEWFFNDDRSGWNAGMRFDRDAPSGLYQIWMGTYREGECDATFSIGRG